VCQPSPNLGEEATRRFPDHPPTVYVRQDGLLEGIFRFFVERIFGPERRELLEADLRALEGKPEQERRAKIGRLRKRLDDLDLREGRLIRSLELDDDPDGVVFRRVRERLGELDRERRAAFDELTALESEEPAANSASVDLLDRLPLGTMDLTSAPEEVLRRLFEAFRLEIRYDPQFHQARCEVWIGEDSLTEAAEEASRVVPVDFAGERATSGHTDVWSAPGRTRTCAPGSGGRRSIHCYENGRHATQQASSRYGRSERRDADHEIYRLAPCWT
jgi:site-specific DNA recombinase